MNALAVRLLALAGVPVERMGASRKPKAGADCIIVPGAWVSAEGEPSDVLVGRLENALALVARGLSQHIVVTGGSIGGRAREWEVALRFLEARSFDHAHVVTERASCNTFENLRNAKAEMDARGWRRAIISTDAAHLPRCMWIAKQVGLEASGSPALESSAYRDRARRRTIAAHELLSVVRYVGTRVRGRVTRNTAS